MIRDFLEEIDDKDIRESLNQMEFSKIVCYPGAGLDPYPCIFVDSLMDNHMAFTDDIPLIVFCDICLPDGLIDIVKRSPNNRMRSDELGAFLSKYSYPEDLLAYSNDFCVQNAKIISMPEFQKGLCFEAVFKKRTFIALYIECSAEELFIHFAKNKISVDLVVLWNEQSWRFNNVIDALVENSYMNELPKRIIRNRTNKFIPLNGQFYKQEPLSPSDDLFQLVCKCRGVETEDAVRAGIARIIRYD